MKTLLYSIFLLLSTTSCVTYKGVYQVDLTNVEHPENSNERYGEIKIVNFEEEGQKKYTYEDDLMKITWLPLSKQFSFNLQNKTEHSIKIIWDEAVFVDTDGSSERIMHAGVKYTDRNASQAPTIIARRGKIDDCVIPTENVYFLSGSYGGWRERPLVPNVATTAADLKKYSQASIGKEMQVLLPIKIKETVNEYLFNFKVKSFTKL